MTIADPPRGEELGNAQFEPAVDVLVTPQRRALLRSRLRRQAWLLDRIGDVDTRDRVLAVSASLRALGTVERASHPFLRAMIEDSIAVLTSNPLLSPGVDPFSALDDGPDLFDDLDLDDEEWDEILEDEEAEEADTDRTS